MALILQSYRLLDILVSGRFWFVAANYFHVVNAVIGQLVLERRWR